MNVRSALRAPGGSLPDALRRRTDVLPENPETG